MRFLEAGTDGVVQLEEMQTNCLLFGADSTDEVQPVATGMRLLLGQCGHWWGADLATAAHFIAAV